MRITDNMTEVEYQTALDAELEEERRKYGDESRMFEKGYDFRPERVRIIRHSLQVAKSLQKVVDRYLIENPLFN